MLCSTVERGQDYPEQNMNTTMTEDSIVIGNLSGGAGLYQFAVVVVDNTEVIGERPTNTFTLPSPTPIYTYMYIQWRYIHHGVHY